ncbi:MCE family protein [Aggregicoccus sp. 17bor-14]|uniref:MlaD family protein n=1 Tax=Myxococcaceae TaxID=31 RepID=UPI00129CE3B7|nr:MULTISPECIES: MlaD family protein [Myxococcaceae]MBF5045007.1 MCE family protein [Simulacricoccus sp. 17bor-14]MRI90750.1 MCE family protein [Aggregicoccus sp. 17bor-14]
MSAPSFTPRERRLTLRVGLFVLAGLVLAGLVVVLIGRENRLFERQVTYRVLFTNVDGLTEQSPVWIGGRAVGKVSAIHFAQDLDDTRIEATLEMSEAFADRVRSDSVARLTSLGVLGEKAVDISLGTAKGERLQPGSLIPTGPSSDLSSLMKTAGQLMEDSMAITAQVRRAVDAYTDPRLVEDVAGTLDSLHGILSEVRTGNGVLHALIYDKKAGAQVPALMANAAGAAQRLDATAGEVQQLLEQVRSGKGSAHALLYERGGIRAVEQLGSAAEEVSKLLADARTHQGSALHELTYGDSGSMMKDLSSAAADIKSITAKVAQGEGSLGGIINDPTVYEDLKTVLGNVKRNRILRALVRYSISNRGRVEDTGKLTQPAAPAAPAAPGTPPAAPPPSAAPDAGVP